MNDPPQEWRIHFDRTFGTQFLTAIAANATLIIMDRRIDTSTAPELHRLGVDGTYTHASPALGALGRDNKRFGDNIATG